MELRKDPITRSWVITGDDAPLSLVEEGVCRYCPGSPLMPQVVSTMPPVDGSPWSAQAVVHPWPLYHIEGDPAKEGFGLYDNMRSVGAHEVLIENPHHDRQLWNASDGEIEQFLGLVGQRVLDLKRDLRFKYISVFKDFGAVAGQEFSHPTSQLVATTFVPRRVLYELRAAKEYFSEKERCVFCDIVAQERAEKQRVVDTRGDYVALCPYAPRVPFETWVLPLSHEARFERTTVGKPGVLCELAMLLKRTLNRIRAVADGFHLVLHTAPNSVQPGAATLGYWKTLDDDYHWHIEILPIVPGKVKSYTVKEVYFTPVTSETAAAKLREIPPE